MNNIAETASRPVRATRYLGLTALALALAGCGGGDDASPTEPPSRQLISYAPIAGVWIGTIQDVNENEVPTRLTLEESAVEGDSVGFGQYIAPAGDCSGPLLAQAANGDIYEVRQVITGGAAPCSNGDVRLTHDPDQATLFFEYFINNNRTSTGILTRE